MNARKLWAISGRMVAGILVAGIVAVLLVFASAPISKSKVLEAVYLSPKVITNQATEITDSTVTLNGELESLGEGEYAAVYWEWGASEVFDKETSPQVMTSPGTFSFHLSGLKPATEYFFRANAANINRAFGETLTFTTIK